MKIENKFEILYSDLVFLYRDTSLEEEYISLYKIGSIIEEKGYCDISHKGGGVNCNLRFLIASNKGKDLSLVDPSVEQYGFVLLMHNSFFRVMDLFTIGTKTQIFLLDISDEGNGYLDGRNSSIEKELIEVSRKDFKEKLQCPIVESLDTEYWENRTEKPVGMFPLSMEPKGVINSVI